MGGPEWGALRSLWSAGLPVPYPVQIDGTEILMEWSSSTTASGAPRGWPRPGPTRAAVEGYFEQLRDAMSLLAQAGIWRTATSRRTTSWPRATGS